MHTTVHMSVFLGTHPTAPAHRVLLAYPYNRELNEHIHAHGYIFDKAARKYWKALHGQATLRELERLVSPQCLQNELGLDMDVVLHGFEEALEIAAALPSHVFPKILTVEVDSSAQTTTAHGATFDVKADLPKLGFKYHARESDDKHHHHLPARWTLPYAAGPEMEVELRRVTDKHGVELNLVKIVHDGG